ncbi:MAG TPA: hypothetical protein VMR70_03045 [Flavisolibacter sp.]|nr:hypothetical protein [Flavisolibacter sp.]
MKELLKPKAVHLLLFGIILIPIFYGLISDSFSSLFGSLILYPLVIGGIILLIFSLLIDVGCKTALLRYWVVGIALFSIMFGIGSATTSNKQEETEQLGLALAEKIKGYKQLYGQFPSDLKHHYFDTLNKNTAYGKPFDYKLYWEDNGVVYFELHFFALNAMDAYLYSTKREWIYVD